MSSKQEDALNMTLSGDMITGAIKTATTSRRFMQALIKASILNIMYQRMVLNDADLKTRVIDGVPIMVFKRKTVKDPLLREFVVWANGIVDAINKNYLKEVFLLLRNPINDKIVEVYRFSLKYNLIDNSNKTRTSPEVQRATSDLLQVINSLGETRKLQEDIQVCLELTYTESTPPFYEPHGFSSSEEKYCLQIGPCYIPMGTINTGFHKVACYGSREVFDENHSVLAIEQAPSENQVENSVEIVESGPNIPTVQERIETSPKVGKRKSRSCVLDTSGITVSDDGDRNVSIISEEMESIKKRYAVTCLCQLSVPLDVDTIECLKCKKLYHAPCHGFLCQKDAIDASFSCVECSNMDDTLHTIEAPDRLLFCRFRLVLYMLNKHSQLPVGLLKLFSKDHNQTILQKLDNFGIIIGKAKRVSHPAVRRIFNSFFQVENSQVLG